MNYIPIQRVFCRTQKKVDSAHEAGPLPKRASIHPWSPLLAFPSMVTQLNSLKNRICNTPGGLKELPQKVCGAALHGLNFSVHQHEEKSMVSMEGHQGGKSSAESILFPTWVCRRTLDDLVAVGTTLLWTDEPMETFLALLRNVIPGEVYSFQQKKLSFPP